jgi:hypothetical protein
MTSRGNRYPAGADADSDLEPITPQVSAIDGTGPTQQHLGGIPEEWGLLTGRTWDLGLATSGEFFITEFFVTADKVVT